MTVLMYTGQPVHIGQQCYLRRNQCNEEADDSASQDQTSKGLRESKVCSRYAGPYETRNDRFLPSERVTDHECRRETYQ